MSQAPRRPAVVSAYVRVGARRGGRGTALGFALAVGVACFARAPADLGSWAFWCLAATGFLASFTTFDQWFRDPSLRALQLAAPIPPAGELAGRVCVLTAWHLPLVALAVASGWDAHPVARVAIGLAVLTQVLLATALHVVLGKSLVSGQNALKAFLSQGLGPPEAALLFYGPAGAFTVALVHAVFVEVGLRTFLLRGDTTFLWGTLTAGGAAVVWLFAQALEVHRRFGPAIAARFDEFDVVPPWREDGLPRRLWGGALAALAGDARDVFVRDLRQYRRRHRVVPLLVVAAVGAAGLAFRSPALGGAAVLAMAALFLNPRAALSGELYRDRGLAIPSSWARRSALLLTVADQGPAAVVLVLAGATHGLVGLLWASGVVAGLALATLAPPTVGRALLLGAALTLTLAGCGHPVS